MGVESKTGHGMSRRESFKYIGAFVAGTGLIASGLGISVDGDGNELQTPTLKVTSTPEATPTPDVTATPDYSSDEQANREAVDSALENGAPVHLTNAEIVRVVQIPRPFMKPAYYALVADGVGTLAVLENPNCIVDWLNENNALGTQENAANLLNPANVWYPDNVRVTVDTTLYADAFVPLPMLTVQGAAIGEQPLYNCEKNSFFDRLPGGDEVLQGVSEATGRALSTIINGFQEGYNR